MKNISLTRIQSFSAVCFGWLASIIKGLATPVVSNWIFVAVLFAIQGVCMWREWIYEDDTAVHFWHMAFDVYILCCFLMIFRKKWRQWIKRVIYILVYLISFFEIFLMERFQIIYTPTSLNLWRETTSKEALEFFSAYLEGSAFWIVLSLFVLVLCLHLLLIFISNRLRNLSFPVIRKYCGLLLNVVIIVLLTESFTLWSHEKDKMLKFATSDQQAEKVKVETFYSPFYRVVYSLRMLQLADSDLNVLRSNMRNIQVDSCTFKCPNIVLVIGESYNKHHCQAYGYKWATSPNIYNMVTAGNAVLMSDAITPWNLTSRVFKNMLTTETLGNKWTDGVLFPALMKKAGYKVAFLTNQFQISGSQNGVDFNGSFFLNDKELDSLCFSYRNHDAYAYDADLIKEYEQYTREKHNFVIFHLYGQHTKYSCRFPEDFRYFTVDSLQARKKLSEEQKQIVADYDNATRYNDNVFAKICKYFEEDDAIVLYLSDHGEEVYDYIYMFGRTPGDHIDASIAYHEFQIPMLFWFSQSFKTLHPEIVAKIREMRKSPFISSNISQLILGLAGVASPRYDATRDLLSPQYVNHQRYLKGELNYDQILEGSRFAPKKK